MKEVAMCVMFLILFILASSAVMAHGGGLDASGGHTNHKDGGYHCHQCEPVKVAVWQECEFPMKTSQGWKCWK